MEDLKIRDNQTLVLTIVDRATGETKSRVKKPKLEEKVAVKYVVRGLDGEEMATSEL
jgi:hypothetical protein